MKKMTGLLQSAAISVLLLLKLTFARGEKFVETLENATFFCGVSFTLKCGVGNSSTAGLEWLFYDGNGLAIRIGEYIGNNTYNDPPSGYHVNRPDICTSILTVLNPNMSSAGKYCCQYKNAQGQTTCAFMTVDSQASHSSMEADVSAVTPVLPTQTMPFDNSTDASPTGNNEWLVGIAVGVVITVIVIPVVPLVVLLVIKRRKCNHSKNPVAAGQRGKPLLVGPDESGNDGGL